MNNIETLLRECRQALHEAAEPAATQAKADIGMVAQWDVDALALIAKIDDQLAAPPAQGEPDFLNMPIPFCEPCKAGRYAECVYAIPCTLPVK